MTGKDEMLVVDIGHSRIACAHFSAGVIEKKWHYPTSEAEQAMAAIAEAAVQERVALACVVPAAGARVSEVLRGRGCDLFELTTKDQTFIKGVYATMGADRVADAAGGWQHFGQTEPVIVVDVGTGTTLTAVTPDRTFAGGYITLGLSRTLEALQAAMPHLPLPSPQDSADGALGFDTPSAIARGTMLGHIGLLSEWVKTARQALSVPRAVAVVTGGWSQVVFEQSQIFDACDPDLTLKGLYVIAKADGRVGHPADRG